MQTVTCPNCGESVKGRFCTSCGTRLDAPPASSAQNLNSVFAEADATSVMRPSDVRGALAHRAEPEERPASVAPEMRLMPDVEDGVPEMEQPAPLSMDADGAAEIASSEPDGPDVSTPERRPSLLRRLMAFFFPGSASEGDGSH